MIFFVFFFSFSIFLAFLFIFFFFLCFIFFCFCQGYLHSGRSEVTRVTVGRDKVFRVCKVNLATLKVAINQTKPCRQFCSVGDKIHDRKLRRFQAEDLKIPNQLHAGLRACSDHKHLFQLLGRARNKQPCLTAAPNQKSFLWTQVRDGKVHLQLWDCVSETFSHPGAEGNLTEPSGKRHSHSHSTDHSHLMWLTTFQHFTLLRTTKVSFV